MPRKIIDSKTGRTVGEEDPDFDRVRIDNLEETVSELSKALVNAQHRLSRLDKEDVPWPGDTYEPTDTRPA